MATSNKNSISYCEHGKPENHCSQYVAIPQTQIQVPNTTRTPSTNSSANYLVLRVESSTSATTQLPEILRSRAPHLPSTDQPIIPSMFGSLSSRNRDPAPDPFRRSSGRHSKHFNQKAYIPPPNNIGAAQRYTMNRFLDEIPDFRAFGGALDEQRLSDDMAWRNRMHRSALAQRVTRLERMIGV